MRRGDSGSLRAAPRRPGGGPAGGPASGSRVRPQILPASAGVTVPQGHDFRQESYSESLSSGGRLGRMCLESIPILWSDLATVHPGRLAVHPTAAGWDEELRTRTAGVRLPRLGRSESLFRTDPSIFQVMLSHRYR